MVLKLGLFLRHPYTEISQRHHTPVSIFFSLTETHPYDNATTAVIGPLPPPRKQWYDKLADALLGDDATTTGPLAASRYALICEKCFTHNGLAREDQWEDARVFFVITLHLQYLILS